MWYMSYCYGVLQNWPYVALATILHTRLPNFPALAALWTEPSDRSDEGNLKWGHAITLPVLILRDTVRGVWAIETQI